MRVTLAACLCTEKGVGLAAEIMGPCLAADSVAMPMHVAPKCTSNGHDMVWSDYSGGDYENGFVCNR